MDESEKAIVRDFAAWLEEFGYAEQGYNPGQMFDLANTYFEEIDNE